MNCPYCGSPNLATDEDEQGQTGFTICADCLMAWNWYDDGTVIIPASLERYEPVEPVVCVCGKLQTATDIS